MSTLETAIKLFGLYLAYRSRQESSGSTAGARAASDYAAERPSAAATSGRKVDPNLLLNMALSHMRNMTNISTRPW